MNLIDYLNENSDRLISETEQKLKHAHLRFYDNYNSRRLRDRLRTLHENINDSISEQRLDPMITYMDNTAAKRFNEGCNLSEVQSALDAAEEVLWENIVRDLPLLLLAENLGLITTVLGAARDAAALKYVTLATQTKVPNVDLCMLNAW